VNESRLDAGPARGQELRVLGCMSGTSVDGIDVACADLRLRGDELIVGYRGLASVPFGDDLHQRIIGALPPASPGAGEICSLHALLGRAYGAAFARARDELAGGRADLAVLHGQTVYHWVDERGAALGTLQLGSPAEVAEVLRIPVISDLRGRDIAAGGQGAPLVAMFDWLLLSGPRGASPAIGGAAGAVNLGGIANLTVVADGQVVAAYDVGPAGALMDPAARRASGGALQCDVGGKIAASGRVRGDLLRALAADPFFALQPPRSTGREHFNAAYLDAALRGIDQAPAPPDIVATVTRLLVDQLAAAATTFGLRELILSGGGSRNSTAVRWLRAALPGTRIRTSDELGIPAQAKEALAFAVLGFLSWHGLPGSLPAATGARRRPILGSVTPGGDPLVLPPPALVAPTSLRLVAPLP
jgi:anhydro-N-acetylmuramic acid kinase